MLSQGVPMLLHGDELGRTQSGNNNGYCQDSELTWIDWSNIDEGLLEFTKKVTKLRTDHPTFRRRRFFHGRPVRRGQGDPVPDIDWLTPAGEQMTDEDWDAGYAKSLAVYLNGHGIRETDERGEEVLDDHFYLAFNASHEPIEFTLPSDDYAPRWTTVLDTAEMDEVEPVELKPGDTVTVQGRPIVVLHGPASRPGTGEPSACPAASAAGRCRRRPTGCRSTPASGWRTPPRWPGYLADLGVTHAYSSPLLRSAEGSNHGYDTVDHAHIDEARGGRPGFDRFVAALHEHGLGLVLDLVPNHMGVADPSAAPWWWDVLQHGQDSAHAAAFDIDWEFGGGKVRIPVLGSADDVDEAGGGRRRAALLRQPLPDRARHRARARRRRCTPASTTSWSTGGAPTPTSTTAGSSRSTPSPGCASRTRRSSTRPTSSCCAGAATAPSTGCGSTTRTAWPTRRATSTGWPRRPAAAGRSWRRSSSPARTCRSPGGPPGRRATTRSPRSTSVLVDPAGEAALTALDTELAGRPVDYAELVHDCKREVTDGMLGSEVARLVRVIGELPGIDAGAADRGAGRAAGRPSRSTAATCPTAASTSTPTVAAVRDRRPDLVPAVDALHPVAGPGRAPRRPPGSSRPAARSWPRASRTAPTTGGRGSSRSTRSAATRPASAARSRSSTPRSSAGAERYPESMTTLSTHDTKRSEDVRARLAVLAELPDRVGARWCAAGWRRHPLADRPLAHLVWQNLVGAWPLSRERAHAYVEKAAREAGTSTTWTDPDEEFEGQLHALVDAAFDDPATTAEIDAFVARIAPFGWSNSLAQKLLQLTMPGVPDVYQGTELWDFSLVDPDNRRPVDYALRRTLLAALDGGEVPAVDETGAAKLLVVSRALRARRDHPGVVRRVRAGRGHRLGGRPRGGLRPRRASSPVATRLPVGLAARRLGRHRPAAAQRRRGATCSPASGSSPTSPAWPPTSCSPACRWPCSSATERGRPGAMSVPRPAWRNHAGENRPNLFRSPRRMPTWPLASCARTGLPGRARGAGPPNSVRRQPDSDPPRTGAGDPLPDAHARLGVKPRRPDTGGRAPIRPNPTAHLAGGDRRITHVQAPHDDARPQPRPCTAAPSSSAPPRSASARSPRRHPRQRTTGPASPSASPAATGASTPATATTAGCSSARRPGRVTAAASTPRAPTWRPRTADRGRRAGPAAQGPGAWPTCGVHLRGGTTAAAAAAPVPGSARGLTIAGPRDLHGPVRRHPREDRQRAGGGRRMGADLGPQPRLGPEPQRDPGGSAARDLTEG